MSKHQFSGRLREYFRRRRGSGTRARNTRVVRLSMDELESRTVLTAVTAVAPAAGTTLANPNMNVTATFDAAIDPTTLTTATFKLFDSGSHLIASAVHYNAGTQTAILIPNVPLNQSSTYTATLVGGSSGTVVKDTSGNSLASNYTWSFTTRSPAPNPIVAENQSQGTPANVWNNVSGSGDDNLQGFTDNISYNVGQTVNFKISTISSHYRIDIYRVGYYHSNGAALKGSIDINLPQAQVQPAPITDDTTGLIDYGTWAVSASWQIPTTAVSGVYVADLVGEDGKTTNSQIVFVVRNDASTSDILFQTDDETWQAYNSYGGNNLYGGSGPGGPYGLNGGSEGAGGRAYMVSYNRPLNDRGIAGGSGDTNQLFYGEYPMIYWLEQNGYNVSYFTGIDAARYGSLIAQHQVYLAAGHDEYWSGPQRANVTAARDAGVNLAFFTGNEDYWKTRLLPSIDGTTTANRTLVSYKETLGTDGTTPAKIDPLPNVWTGTWRDPSFSPPADGGRPENALGGTIFTVNRGPSDGSGSSILVPAIDALDRLWANSAVANLQPGQVYTSAINLLGYEWDSDLDNGFRPAGLIDLSSTTVNVPELLLNNGSIFGPGTATHSLTLYRADSGALVFGAGTVQWSWGLATVHDGVASSTDVVIQQATVNVLGEMGAQPATLQAGLSTSSPPGNRTPPASTITSVNNGLNIRTGYPVTVTGTAADSSGGVVAGVEVSVDGGKTWHPATGHGSWSYTWTPTTAGPVTILSRATADNNYTEVPGPGVTVTVLQDSTTPPQIVNVQATVINNQTVTITWTTDENATSVVTYGTNLQALNLSASSATMVTAHSITLTNLRPNSVYYFRVTSVDKYNNSTTVPPNANQPNQFSTPAFIANGVSSFSAGQTVANTYISQMNGGVVILAPAVGTEFPGTSLPAGWFSTPWSSGGTATVANNQLTVNGARAGTSALYGPGRSLEFTATFSSAKFEIVGFGVDYSSGPWAAFSTAAGGGLYAETSNGTASNNTQIPGNWLGSAHDYRIDWTSSAVNYSIDGILIYSSPIVITGNMRPLASALTPGAGVVTVNWMHMTPYATSGTYLSQIFDGGQSVTWTLFNDSAIIPAGTGIALSVRIGNTPTPDNTWTDWVPVSGAGAVVGASSRYLQYQATLTTTNPAQTPILQTVTLSYNNNPGSDVYPPQVLAISPAANTTNVSPTSGVVIKFNKLLNPATVNTSTVQLVVGAGPTSVSATVSYSGSTVTLQPVGLLLSNQQYQVVVSGSITDSAGNPLGSNVTLTFTTGLATFTNTTVSAFSAAASVSGTYLAQSATYTPQNGAGEVILAPVAGSEFFGTALPAGWFATILGTGGSATVANGVLTVDGALVGTNQFYSAGTSLQFKATFSGDPYQHVGLGVDFNTPPWMAFSTGSGGALYARTHDGHSFIDTPLPGNWLGAPHVFRIDWNASTVIYYIDGTQVASHTFTIRSGLRLLVDDNTPGGGVVTVNWMRLAPYAASGVYISSVFDAGTAVTWNTLLWTGNTPTGTGIALSVRMGNTATPDSTWTAWVPMSASGAVIGGSSRYLQYEAILTTTNPNVTPDLDSVTPSYEVNPDTFPPTIVGQTPAPGAVNIALNSTVTVSFRELMNAATISGSTVTLTVAGTGQQVPATVTLAGSTVTLQPTAALISQTLYRVTVSGTVTDSSGNPLGSNSTWTFTTGWLSFVNTTIADFSTGSNQHTYIAKTQTGSGQVILAPAAGAEFLGSALPAGWSATIWGSGGTATVANGQLTLDGAGVSTNTLFGPGASLQFKATFSGDPYEHAGFFGQGFNTPWAIFSTGSGGVLYARTHNGASSMSTLLSGNWLGAMHCFRIDWNANNIVYSIDGVQVATHNLTVSGSMGAAASDLNVGGGTVVVAWMRASPYAPSGTFVSQVFDGGQTVTWNNLVWTSTVPAGTSLAVSVRMGNTPTPDGTWTSFVPLSGSGAIVGGASRYLQYRVDLTTTISNQTPSFQGVTVNYTTQPDTIAPTVVNRSPAPGATGVDLLSAVNIYFSELMNAGTINASTVTLTVAGTGQTVPASVTLVGSITTIGPATALAANTFYQVTVSGTITDSSGNPLGSNLTWTFTTGTGVWRQSTTADFSAGVQNGTTATNQSGSGVRLAPTFEDDFNGTSLSSAWTHQDQTGSGGGPESITVANGILSLGGTVILSVQTFSNTPVEGLVNFAAATYQHFGMATSLNSASGNYWAIFSTSGTTSTLFARVNVNGATQDISLGAVPVGFHDYVVKPVTGGFQFCIDGVAQATISASLPTGTALRIVMAEFLGPPQPPLQVDWVRLVSYPSSGTFTSSVFDASRTATWGTANWTATLPAGTTLTVMTRSGNTATPDGTWSAWTAVSSGGTVASPSGRYLQYSVVLTTTDPTQTADLLSISVNWA